ncbi:MAG: MlaD family protein [Solirubrobacteraceae bacterium]
MTVPRGSHQVDGPGEGVRATTGRDLGARRTVGIVVIAALLALGTAFVVGVLPPGGDDDAQVTARFAGHDAEVPGRGQRVTVAGVPVGRILSVTRESRTTVVRFSVADRHARLLRSDARVTVRPETAVDDMVLALDPGRDGRPAPEDLRIGTDRTDVRVRPDRVYASLDADTAAALRLLTDTVATGLGGDATGDRVLRAAGRLDGTVRRLTRATGRRRAASHRALRDVRLLAEALVEHRGRLRRALTATAATLDTVAGQDEALRAAVRELPATVRSAERALVEGARLVDAATPVARAASPLLADAPAVLRRTRGALADTLPALRDGIVPLVRDTAPALRALGRHAATVDDLIDDTGAVVGTTERTLNALSYDPPGPIEGRLFWAQWLVHLAPWVVGTQDAHGPMARALLLSDCTTLRRIDRLARVNPAGGLLGAVLRPSVTTGLCPARSGGDR